MKTQELIFSEIRRKTISLFMTPNKIAEVAFSVQIINSEPITGGICRTPADSVVLRANEEPWA